jgi:hypothetical protein
MSGSITPAPARAALGALISTVLASALPAGGALGAGTGATPDREMPNGTLSASAAGHEGTALAVGAPGAAHLHMPGMSMSGMSMSGMTMPSSVDLADPMSRESSGTAWIPDSSPMYGRMYMRGGNMLMLHGAAFPRYTDVGSKRGSRRLDAPSWFMGMLSHPLDKRSQLGVRLMMSLDPVIEGQRGYPLLFQTGESAHGLPLHDRQHPHDLFSELSATYSRLLGGGNSAYLYLGYPGEPALGPPTFMHRLSAMDDPDAPLGHHWQDSTHITFGVITAGLAHRKAKLEGSVFTGREPDENRYDFDTVRLRSYSGRLSWNPSHNLALQVSHGFLKSPEALDATVDVHRTSASLVYNKPLGPDANWATTAVWGQNEESDTRQKSNSYLVETNYQRGANAWYARAELVQKSGHELVLQTPALGERLFDVGGYTIGYVRDLNHPSASRVPGGAGIDVGLGAQITVNSKPSGLDPFYGSGTPVGFEIFLRIRPSRMDHAHQHMAGPMPAAEHAH